MLILEEGLKLFFTSMTNTRERDKELFSDQNYLGLIVVIGTHVLRVI